MFTAVQTDKMRKKSSHFRTSSSLNMAVRGGLTRFARPAGSPLTAFVVCPTGCASCRTPVGASHPPGVHYAKKSSHFRTSSSLNMAVRGGLTRFARPAGSPLTAFVVCPTGCASCRTPVGASHPPGVHYAKKSSHFRTSSSLNMAVRGGLTRFARPAGSPLTAFVVCPTGCASCRTPVGASHPPGVHYAKKSSHFRTSSSLNMAVRGGLTRFARPAGSPLTAFVVCPTGCASCRTPVGASHPPGVHYAKKSSHFRTSSSLNMAVRGGFEPPIRCRIHTFQACSFSHSDTSPNCFVA